MKEYQVTLFNPTGHYRPVSCIVKMDMTEKEFKDPKAFMNKVKNAGIVKICQKRYWTIKDLKKYEYTRVKIREYIKENK